MDKSTIAARIGWSSRFIDYLQGENVRDSSDTRTNGLRGDRDARRCERASITRANIVAKLEWRVRRSTTQHMFLCPAGRQYRRGYASRSRLTCQQQRRSI